MDRGFVNMKSANQCQTYTALQDLLDMRGGRLTQVLPYVGVTQSGFCHRKNNENMIWTQRTQVMGIKINLVMSYHGEW